MPENILERAFERATPGFDSRVALLNTQAERIRQNNALAQEQAQKILEEEREYQRRLALEQAKSDITLGRQADMEMLRRELDAPEKQQQMIRQLMSDSLDIQSQMDERYAAAREYGFIPSFTVVPDVEFGQPIIHYKQRQLNAEGEYEDVMYEATALQFNNQFSDMVDAANLLKRAEELLSDRTIQERSTNAGLGRNELRELYNNARNRDPDSLATLRQGIASINRMTGPEANRQIELTENINANFSGALELIKSNTVGTLITEGRRSWWRKDIPPITTDMSINEMLATAEENRGSFSESSREYADYTNFINYINSLKVGMSQMGINFNYDEVTLNSNWDFTRVDTESLDVPVEDETARITSFRDEMSNIFVRPGQQQNRMSDVPLVQRRSAQDNAASALINQ